MHVRYEQYMCIYLRDLQLLTAATFLQWMRRGKGLLRGYTEDGCVCYVLPNTVKCRRVGDIHN